MATAKEIKKAMAKKQGFSGKILLEHLAQNIPPTYEAQEWYCQHYHANEIPAKYFDGGYAIVMAKLSYIDKRGRRHRATVGMLTDGGSIPRFLWDTIGAPFASKFLPAYILHDYYCQRARDISERKMRKRLRLDADKLFLECIEHLGAGFIIKKLLYSGVRIGSIWN